MTEDAASVRNSFQKRLGSSWQELADLLDIPHWDQATWPRGREPAELWRWLELRGRLVALPEALTHAGRPDLAELAASVDLDQTRLVPADQFNVFEPAVLGRLLMSGIASTSLALPQRSVPADRLRGRAKLVESLTAVVRQRASCGGGTSGVYVLCGIGGAGKTTVALEAAHQVRQAVRVWWVSASAGDSLTAALQAVAFDIGARAGDFAVAHPADVLWRHLDASERPWLLVLDNVDDPRILSAGSRRLAEGVGWLRVPGSSHGTVIVTSRASQEQLWADWVELVPVGLLGTDDAASMLRDLAPQAGDEVDARLLARRLDGLPLALHLAGSYLGAAAGDIFPDAETPGTFVEYSALHDQRLGELAVDLDPSLTPEERDRRTLTKTFELSLGLLAHRGMYLARPLLRLLSCFGPGPVPHLVVLDPAILAISPLFADATRPRIGEALQGLAGLSLITSEVRDHPDRELRRLVDMHPLVRGSNKSHPDIRDNADEYLTVLTALLNSAAGDLDPDDPSNWPRWQVLAPHAGAALELLRPEDDREPVLLSATTPAVNAARYRLSVGLWADAIHDLREILRLQDSRLGGAHAAVLGTRLHLARAYYYIGSLRRAEEEFRTLVVALSEHGAAQRAQTLSARAGLARVLYELGDYVEAERELRFVFDAHHGGHFDDDRELLRTRHELAKILHRQDRLGDAASELTALIDEYRDTPASLADPHLLSCRTSLARVLRDEGRTTEAAAVCAEVLAECRQVFEPEHPALLVARHEAARIARDLGRLSHAESEFREICAINTVRLGDEHPMMCASLHELATVRHLQGALDEAETLFIKVLEANQRRLGDNHPDTLACQRNLNTLREARNDGVFDDDQAGGPDVTGFSLAEALSPDRSESGSPPRRLLGRIANPRTNRGSGPPGGYSSDYYRRTTIRTSQQDAPESGLTESPTEGPTYRPSPQIQHWQPLVVNLEQPESDTSGSTRDSNYLPLGAWNLATGQPRLRHVTALLSTLTERRVVLFNEIAAEVNRRGLPDNELPPLAAARSLLARAASAAPQRVQALLVSPRIGRWMARTLRRLWDHETESSVPLWVDVGFAHALAAAAAVRAGLDFRCEVPVQDGAVFLPSVGLTDLGTAGWRAVVQAVAGHIAFTTVSSKRLVSQDSDAWRPVRRIQVGWLDIEVEEFGPYLPDADGAHPDENLEVWQSLVDAAWRTIVKADAMPLAICHTIRSIAPRPPEIDGRLHTASSSDAFGGMVISRPHDPLELAESFVHESRHMHLDALLDVVELYTEPDDGHLFYAPWRDDPRPLAGLFHGVYAFFGVFQFWSQQARHSSGPERRHSQFELAYWRTQAWDAAGVLRSSPRLTRAGHQLLEAMMAAARPIMEADVPDDIAAMVAQAVHAHRARWRLHHLRPDQDLIQTLANAWPSNTVEAGDLSRGSTLTVDDSGHHLDRGRDLWRAAATDPRRHSAPTAALSTAAVDDRLERDSNDLDAWVDLGAAMVHDGICVADEPAAECPEVVRTVHAAIRARSATPPPASQVAEWLASFHRPQGVYSPF